MWQYTLVITKLTGIKVSMIRLIIRWIKTQIKAFLINLLHNIQSKFNRTIRYISQSRLRYIFKGMPPHVINSFKLLIRHEINLGCSKSIQFIIVLKQLITNWILHYIRINDVKIDSLRILIMDMPFIIFHEFNTLNWYCEIYLFL